MATVVDVVVEIFLFPAQPPRMRELLAAQTALT